MIKKMRPEPVQSTSQGKPINCRGTDGHRKDSHRGKGAGRHGDGNRENEKPEPENEDRPSDEDATGRNIDIIV